MWFVRRKALKRAPKITFSWGGGQQNRVRTLVIQGKSRCLIEVDSVEVWDCGRGQVIMSLNRPPG